MLMSEVNTKWTTQKKEKMRSKLAKLHQNIELISADSGDYDLTERDQLPGGIMNAFWGPIVSIIDKNKITVDKLGKWTACTLIDGKKSVAIIIIYRIP